MKYCSKCGTAMEDNAAFCPTCGEKQAPIVAQPVYNPENQVPVQSVQPAYTPAYDPNLPPQKTVSVKDKVFGYVGFGLSTYALIMSTITFFMGLASLGSMDLDLASTTVGYSLIFIASGIIGLIFSKNSENAGNISTFTKLGKIFGIISLPLFSVAFLFGVIALG